MYYSQDGEDKYICETFFKAKQNGFFIELGACDGLHFSNTKFFEDQRSWTGILIEPQPVYFNQIAKNRPKSITYNCAILDSDLPIEMVVRSWLNEGDPVGTLAEYTFSEHRTHWHSENSKSIQVNTRRLDDILHENSVESIDLFSLDVEGSEFEVLQTMNWSIPVGVLLIEMLKENEDKNTLCRNLLLQNNYTFHSTIGNNEIWLGTKELK